MNFPGFGRKKFEQKVVDLAGLGFAALDDEVYINTQSGSQWDSLKHFAHQKSRMYYVSLMGMVDRLIRRLTDRISNSIEWTLARRSYEDHNQWYPPLVRAWRYSWEGRSRRLAVLG